MREILFRGKRKDNGEWVYGNYAFIDTNKKQHFIFQNKALEYEIIPETVGQYTGLTDKNGKKIFEGDIIKYFCNDYRPNQYDVHQILFDDETAKFIGKLVINNFTISLYKRNELKYEVIGNIHDNPELLGDK